MIGFEMNARVAIEGVANCDDDGPINDAGEIVRVQNSWVRCVRW